jgi:hypothetical protein
MALERTHRRFRLTKGQIISLAVVTALSLGTALALRYGLVEPKDMTAQCDAGAQTMPCLIRRVTVGIFLLHGFGFAALAAATLAVIRPAFVLLLVACVAGVFGLVLYNTTVAGLGVSLLPLMFARPRPKPDFAPE